MQGYDALDEASQVVQLRRLALDAAPKFGLSVDVLTLVEHGFNTTCVLAAPVRRLDSLLADRRQLLLANS